MTSFADVMPPGGVFRDWIVRQDFTGEWVVTLHYLATGQGHPLPDGAAWSRPVWLTVARRPTRAAAVAWIRDLTP